MACDEQPKFVVQSIADAAYDLRLEKDGVFKSWAVPKGVPQEVGVKRLAIQVADHGLEFGDFEGEIPAGEYGAGKVEIWDRGSYHCTSWTDDKISLTFHGTRLQGTCNLIRFPRGGKKAWLIFKRSVAGWP